MTPRTPARDPVLEALEQLLKSLHEGVGRLETAIRLATEMRERRLDGEEYWEIEEAIDGPSVPDRITTNLLVLQAKARRLRKAGARALREEGLTLEEVAQLFGVSHQRVSALLREDDA
jgi:hypothetical protein